MKGSEREASWEAVRSGKARLVVGVRSGVFAPVPELGLIIVDEEHDPSFRQEDTPSYNARDVAVKRGQIEEVPVILGSATPSFESWNNSVSGKYQLAVLPERVTPSPDPELIVVDMSGSMLSYTDLMVKSVLEVLEPLDETNEFAIIGYQGNPSPVIWNFPETGGLLQGTEANLDAARNFIQSLARRFAGSTPTHYAVLSAMQYPADAIILMSDGEPDNAPGFIVQDVTSLNRRENKEIHTVAIGDYTQNRGLVMFLQTLARQNNGDFVGVSR
jgi:hypothetical protein